MAIGQARLEELALALSVPVVCSRLPSRAWRFTWAVRAAFVVVGVRCARGVRGTRHPDELPVRVPDVAVLLVPVALGVALSAAAGSSSFGGDVAPAGRSVGVSPLAYSRTRGGRGGVLPATLTLTDGAWSAPRTTVVEAAEAQLPTDPEIGDYRVIYLGDPRVLPVPVDDLGDGVSMALVDDGRLDLRDRWAAPAQDADQALVAAIHQIHAQSTLRGGVAGSLRDPLHRRAVRFGTERTRPRTNRCRSRPAFSTRSDRSSTSPPATARPTSPCSRTGRRSRRRRSSTVSWPRPLVASPLTSSSRSTRRERCRRWSVSTTPAAPPTRCGPGSCTSGARR